MMRLLSVVVAFLVPVSSRMLGYVPTHRPHSSTGVGSHNTVVDDSSTLLKTLYPPTAPYKEGKIAVDPIHTLHYEEHGNPNGLPALFLHGGPGAGCFANHARFFNPEIYRIILLDQRGAGRSQPRGEIHDNTLSHLVEDCETLRSKLDLERWEVVLGGSWGSTLALAYAQEYPESIGSLVLRGVCLLRPQEVDWLFGGEGAAKGDVRGWHEFQKRVDVVSPAPRPREALHAHYNHLMGDDAVTRLVAAQSWMQWEMRTGSRLEKAKDPNAPVLVTKNGQFFYEDVVGESIDATKESPLQHICTLKKGISSKIPPLEKYEMKPVSPEKPLKFDKKRISQADAAQFVPAQAMLTCFYSVNERFATSNRNFLDAERIKRIQKIPCIAVHGGLDEICPVDTALELSAAWPEMELRIPTKAGHSMYDAAILNELVKATDRLAETKTTD